MLDKGVAPQKPLWGFKNKSKLIKIMLALGASCDIICVYEKQKRLTKQNRKSKKKNVLDFTRYFQYNNE